MRREFLIIERLWRLFSKVERQSIIALLSLAILLISSFVLAGFSNETVNQGSTPGSKQGTSNEQDTKCPSFVDSEFRKNNKLQSPLHGETTLERHVQACNAIVGPFPSTFDCKKGTPIPVIDSRDGKEVTRGSGGKYYKEGKLFTDWSRIECAHPSLAPGFERDRCAIGSRLVLQTTSEGVVWVAFCRAERDLAPEETSFTSMSVMGWNRNGEVCFLDYQPGRYAPDGAYENVLPPHSKRAADVAVKPFESGPWLAPAESGRGNNCLACHGSSRGMTLSTPYIIGAGLDLHQYDPKGFRPVGELGNGLNRRYEAGNSRSILPKLNGQPDTTCTKCHSIPANQEFLLDSAVGIGSHNKAWMPPGVENATPTELEAYRAAVKRIKYCIENPNDETNCSLSTPATNQCPPPPDLHTTARLKLSQNENLESVGTSTSYLKELTISLGNYRDPEVAKSGNRSRDDVRLQLTLTGSDGTSCLFKDISPQADSPGRRELKIPAKVGVSYSVSMKAIRICDDLQQRERAGDSVTLSVKTGANTSSVDVDSVPHALRENETGQVVDH